MENKQKLIGGPEILYTVLCLINMYIVPVVLWYGEFLFVRRPDWFLFAPGLWICGFGGIFQMLAGAVYGVVKKQSDEKWFWINILLGLPVVIGGAVFCIKSGMPEYVYISCESEFLLTCAYIFIILFQGAAGIWLGRKLSGKNRETRCFYLSDILYTAAAALCCAVLCIALKKSWIIADIKGNSYYERARFYVVAMFFAVSVLYGLFSKFDALSERLVRAMTAGFLIFTVFNIVYITDVYRRFVIRHGASLAKAHKIQVLLGNSGFWPVIFAGIAAVGVFVGYYWRIVLSDEKAKKVNIKKPVIVFVAAALLVAAGASGLNYQFMFYEQRSLWSVIDVASEDIYRLELRTNSEKYETTDSDRIERFINELGGQRGCVLKYFPEGKGYRALLNGYTVKAYDKSDKIIFEMTMIHKGEMNVRVVYRSEYRRYNFLIPKQYYGKEKTDFEIYKTLITGDMWTPFR